MPQRMFRTMPPDVARFYHTIVNRALLNILAVKLGIFDTIFCQTVDPTVYSRWEQKLPGILTEIELRQGPASGRRRRRTD